jgi:hypothetical protein
MGKAARPCCWSPSGHADACPGGQRKSVCEPIFTVACRPRWSICPKRLPQLHRALPSRSSTSIDDRVYGARISIAPAAPSPSPSRDFLPWPFAYAGRRCAWRRRHGTRPEWVRRREIARLPWLTFSLTRPPPPSPVRTLSQFATASFGPVAKRLRSGSIMESTPT